MKFSAFKFMTFIFVVFVLNSCNNDDCNNLTEKQGKVNIYIEGDLTNAEAQAQLEEEYGYQTENIYVQYTTQLTEISINANYKLRSIDFKDNNLNLSNITLKGNNTKISNIIIRNSKKNTTILIEGFLEADIVQIFTYGYISDSTIPTSNTTNIVCNDLYKINQQLTFIASIQNNNSIAFNDLKIVEASNPTYYWSFWRGKFNNISFPKLEEMSNLKTSSSDTYTNVPNYILGLSVSSLNFPLLKKINSFYINGKTGIDQLIFPELVSLKDFYVNTYNYFNDPNLIFYNEDRFQFPQLQYCEKFYLFIPSFDSDAVNFYLNKFVSINPFSNKIISLYGEPPTGQGIIDKQTLINNNNIVNTN